MEVKKLIIIFLVLGMVYDQSVPCEATVYNLLTDCNLTCKTCGAQRNICEECTEDLVLLGTDCVDPPNTTLFQNYFFQGAVITNDTLGFEKFKTQTGIINSTIDFFQLCIAGLYRFEILGRFSAASRVSYTNRYALAISQVSFSMRFFSFQNLNTIFFFVNKRKQFEITYNFGANIANNTANPQLIVDVDLGPTRDNVMVPLRTGYMDGRNSRQIEIEFYVEADFPSNQTSTLFWGFSQVTILAKQCNQCVSDEIQELARIIGIGIGACAALLLFLVIILCLCVKWRQSVQKTKRKEKFQKLKKEEHSKNE